LQAFEKNPRSWAWLHRLTVNIVLMHVRKRKLPEVSLEATLEPIEEGGPRETTAAVIAKDETSAGSNRGDRTGLKSDSRRVRIDAEKVLTQSQGVLKVLEKCANTTCLTVFRRQGDGMLFRVPRAGATSGQTSVGRKLVAMEHFWLCNECAETMTLGIDRQRKVTVIPLSPARNAVAS
jgi:hypothetical protein